MTHTVKLTNQTARERAHWLINRAPPGYVVSIAEPKRTTDQNSLLWAILTDVSLAKPLGRKHIPEMWKSIFMAACGYEQMFLMGLDGNPFPAGFRSSQLTKGQFSDLIEYIRAWGTEHGVQFSDQQEKAA